MNITNKYKLPNYVYDWITYDSYDHEEGVISSTKLLSPPRQFVLMERNKDDLEIDASDLIASKYGTAIHDSVEQVKTEGVIKELRLYSTVNIDGEDWRISGKFDMMADVDKPIQKLVDIKSTSVWTYILGGKDEDYIKQLSVYKYLANRGDPIIIDGEERKFKVGTYAEIFMVFTDWQSKKAREDPTYPQIRTVIKPIRLWDDDKTLEYIKERLRLFRDARKIPDSELSKCEEKDLWKKPDNWEVRRKGAQRATRKCKSEEEARTFLLNNRIENAEVYLNKGEVMRCHYCTVRKYCDQFKELFENGYIDKSRMESEEVSKYEQKKRNGQRTLN